MRYLIDAFYRASVLVALLTLANVAKAQAPDAPPTSTGDYTVSYVLAPGAGYAYLEERVGSSGTWQFVDGYYGGSVSFGGKPSGHYYYRKVDMYYYVDEYWAYTYYPVYSPETHVIVTNGPVPTPDTLLSQHQYQFQSRAGDIDGDGRTDIFVDRVFGGQPGNGTLSTFILQQNATPYPSFTPFVPDPGQTYVASQWPIVGLGLSVNDVDLDGFVDLNITGLGSLIGNASDVIVFSSGEILQPMPSGLRYVTHSMRMFLNDSRAAQFNPNHFADAFYYEALWAIDWYCPYGYYWDEWYLWTYCIPYPYIYGYQLVFNSGAYSWDAYEVSGAWGAIEAAQEIFANTTNAIVLSNVFERVFGRKPFKGVLHQVDGDAIAVPGDIPIPDVPDDAATKRWWRFLRIFAVITIELEALDYLQQFRPILRIVDDPELADIALCQCFRTVLGQLEVKQFWMDAFDAEWWATVGMTRYTAGDGLRGSNRHRSMVFTWIRLATWQAGVLISEPPTKGHLDYYGPTLTQLNIDIQTNPFGRIKKLRDYAPLDVPR